MGYPIDLFLFCQWLQTVPSLGVPHYQPRNFPVAAIVPRMRVVSRLWPALGRAPTPQQGWPVEAAARRTGGMGQGQGLVLVQVTGCHRSMSALVRQCVNTKNTQCRLVLG